MEEATLVETMPEDEQLSLVRLAMLLAGDEAAGINLLARSALHTPDHEDAIDAQDYALETARRQLVRTYIAGKGRLRDQKIRRATIALRFFGDLSVAETARTLDLAMDRVVAVELDAAAIEGDLHETWARVLGKGPDMAQLIPEIHRQRQQAKGRRRRAGILITVAAMIMAAAVIVPTVVVPRLPHTAHQAGEWAFVHTVEPPEGWSISRRSITSVSESTLVSRLSESSSEERCRITLYAPGQARSRLGFDPRDYSGDDVRVDSRHGSIIRLPQAKRPILTWRYGSEAWAIAECSAPLEELNDALLKFTEWISYEPADLSVPVRMVDPPVELKVVDLQGFVDPPDTAVALEGDAQEWGVFISVSSTAPSFPDPELIKIHHQPWLFGAKNHQLCHGSRDTRILCVSASGDLDSTTKNERSQVRTQLIEVAESLRLAPNLNDPSTWFDAAVAFP